MLTLLALAAAGAVVYLVLRRRRAVHEARVAAAWAALAARRGDGAFDPAMVEGLPPPARRWLLHAIAPGTPLAGSVELEMSGAFRAKPYGGWFDVTAREVLAPPAGLVWRARVGMGRVWLAGADLALGSDGEVRFRIWDLIPAVRDAGPDVARSAAGRLAAESIWLPPAFLPERGARWEALDDDSARVTLPTSLEPVTLTLTVAGDGALERVSLLRWGNHNPEHRFVHMPFGALVLEERSFGGYTIPSSLGVAWGDSPDRDFEFFRARVTDARFR